MLSSLLITFYVSLGAVAFLEEVDSPDFVRAGADWIAQIDLGFDLDLVEAVLRIVLLLHRALEIGRLF